MRKILLLNFLFAMIAFQSNAQLPDGSIAPNFIATDIDGVEHNLYDILDSGRDVIIDFSATWCGPCWSYHTTHTLNDLQEAVGENGTNEAMVFYVECDVTTTMADLLGNTAASQGNWVAGTNYPIIDNSGIASAYQIGSYPTILEICADRKIKNVGRLTVPGFQTELGNCPSIDYPSEPFFYADKYVGCESLDVQFTDDSWPRPTHWSWDFGDGNTSNEQSPSHTYSAPGDYSVTLAVGNDIGDNITNKENLISVGSGVAYPEQIVGPEDNNIGTGRYFEGGHQALIFDAFDDAMLNTVRVFSDKEGDRTVVLLDSNGEIVNIKTVFIPEGDQRVEINFFIPEGSDYRLGLRSDAFLFRNDGGTAYPYKIDDLISITESTASTTPLQYYYYFYDWSVMKAGCTTPSNVDDVYAHQVTVYPNPASEILNVQLPNVDNLDISLADQMGRQVLADFHRNGQTAQFNISGLPSGLYYVRINGIVKKFYKN